MRSYDLFSSSHGFPFAPFPVFLITLNPSLSSFLHRALHLTRSTRTFFNFVRLPAYVQILPDSPVASSFGTRPQQPTQRKWHCVAYFSAADWHNLPSVDTYADLKNIVVPEGVYTSTKGTGKTGAAPIPPYHPDELAMNSGVGPIRRPMSRGDLNSSPYSTNGAPYRAGRVEGPTSPGSSSGLSDDPRSPTSACDSPVSHHPHSSSRGTNSGGHGQQPSPLHAHQPPLPSQNGLHPNSHPSSQHHHHSSSTSSASTGSPPTPGFMAPIPSPSTFTSSGPSRSYSQPPPLPVPSQSSLVTVRKASNSLSALSSSPHPSGSEDVVMVDAPTLRTPTKDHPHYPYLPPSDTRSSVESEHSARSLTDPGSRSATALPSFHSILEHSRISGPAGRSKEDSMALGAFRLTL